MNRLDHNNDTPHELDALLGAYFQAEMPHPWPRFRRSQGTTLPPQAPGRESSWWTSASRLALALSVALLLSGGLFLGGMTAPTERPASFSTGDGTAAKGQLPPPPPEKEADPAELTPEELDKMLHSRNK